MCDITPRLCHPVPAAAHELGISRSSLFVLLKQKRIESILVMGRRVVPHQSLVDYVNRIRECGDGGDGSTTTPSTPHMPPMRSADAGGSPH